MTGTERFANVVRNILQTNPSSGWGIVASRLGPDEINLQGRTEKILLAGNVIPAVGERVFWLKLDDNRVVVTKHVRPLRPFIPTGARARRVGSWIELPLPSPGLRLGQHERSQSAAWLDSAGNYWTLLFEAADEYSPRDLLFYRGQPAHLLEEAGWAEKGRLEFAEITGGYYGGPGWHSTAFTINNDKLCCWWQQEKAWYEGTADCLQYVEGTIDPTLDTLSLSSVAALTPGLIAGFAGNTYANSTGITRDENGYLWLSLCPQANLAAPGAHVEEGEDFPVGTYEYAWGYVSSSGQIGLSQYQTLVLTVYSWTKIHVYESADNPPPAGTTERWLYRRRPGYYDWGLVATFPASGAIDWYDSPDNIPGDPPTDFLPVPESTGWVPLSGILIGRSNSPNTLADGVTWETLAAWDYPWYQPAILPRADGSLLVVAATGPDTATSIVSWLRSPAGVWSGPFTLLTGAYMYLGPPTLLEHSGSIYLAVRHDYGDEGIYQVAQVTITDDVVSLATPVAVAGGDPCPRLCYVQVAEALLLADSGYDFVGRLNRLENGKLEAAGDPLDMSAADSWGGSTPPTIPEGQNLAVLYTTSNGQLGVVEWQAE